MASTAKNTESQNFELSSDRIFVVTKCSKSARKTRLSCLKTPNTHSSSSKSLEKSSIAGEEQFDLRLEET